MRTMLSPPRPGRLLLGRLPALAACWLLAVGAVGVQADQGRPERPRIPVVLFDVIFEATPLGEGPDADAMTHMISEAMIGALRSAGYDPILFNPESPSIARAVGREHTLSLEDTAHPEKEASARKIAAACGARYVLFPKLMEMTLDLSKGQTRLQLGLRIVPDIGAEREVTGGGAAQQKPERRAKRLAERILKEAFDVATREVVQSLTGVAGANAPETGPREAETYYAEAMQSLKENRVEAVIPLLERATRLDPRNVDYAVALGDIYQRTGQAANAQVEYRRAVTIQPANIGLRVRLAKIMLERSMVREASAELRRAANLAPENPDVRTTLMEVYLRNGMLEEALVECRRMMQARPDDAGIRVTLGDLHVRRGVLDDARKEYDRAVVLDPNNPVPHERLAGLYRQRGMHSDALRELILAQRTPAGADDAARYRVIAGALDDEAQVLLNEAEKTATAAKNGVLIREDAYATARSLVARADALATEMGNLKAPAAVKESHTRRAFAYSLLAQCLFAYVSFFENDREEEGANAAALHAQATRELHRAKEALAR